MRRFSHVLGFDDAPFAWAHRGDVTVIGALYAGERLEGVLRGRVRRDGVNSTRQLARLCRGSRFAGHLRLVMLQGIALAGFNVVDLGALSLATGLPVLVVARHRPDLRAIRAALLERVPGGRRKWRRIERAGPMEPSAGGWVQRAGLTLDEAEGALRATARHGLLPEPLRTAHLIAGGITLGESQPGPELAAADGCVYLIGREEGRGVPITFHHRVARDDLAFGVLVVRGLDAGPAPAALAEALTTLVARRKATPLSPAEEVVRGGARDVLRNGKYKPTGRSKPASEYLLRAAGDGSFPTVNGPVDANNLVSLEALVPISVWDLAVAGTEELELRLGRAGESFVFNPAGQVLELEDLVCGCGLDPAGASRPLVTPVKDGLATKLRPDTRDVAGCIYFPLAAGGEARLREVTAELLRWLLACGPARGGASGALLPGRSLTLEVAG
jgi:endonuclease V-like protein UPF0215 family/DNA/RNA-binding domain of Phe-tRNA-synthetase-like protein